jgi:RimJ/RimL family protein N-acetyltransferase
VSDRRPTLTTARLVLRPFVPEDAPEVRRLAGAAEVAATTLVIPHPYPEGAAETWIGGHAEAFDRRRQVDLAITLRDGGALVGAIGLVPDSRLETAELGYWIAVGHWGRGYATEAVCAVIPYGFATLGLHRIQAQHFLGNPASGRVMEKAGMRYEGIRRGAVRKGDRFEDVAVFAALADDLRDP